VSTVVFKEGVLASDSLAYGGKGQPSPGFKQKARRLADGSRIGVVTGVIGLAERFVAWVEAGADPAAWVGDAAPDIRAIWVKPDGGLFLADDGLYFSGPIKCEVYAIGSGAEYAMGAMAMGASPAQAIEVASRLDQHTGGPVIILEA
jgi:hypothetical protein